MASTARSGAAASMGGAAVASPVAAAGVKGATAAFTERTGPAASMGDTAVIEFAARPCPAALECFYID